MRSNLIICLLISQILVSFQQVSSSEGQGPLNFTFVNIIPLVKQGASYLLNMTLENNTLQVANESSVQTLLLSPTLLSGSTVISYQYAINSSLNNSLNTPEDFGFMVDMDVSLGSCLINSEILVLNLTELWDPVWLASIPAQTSGFLSLDTPFVTSWGQFVFCGQYISSRNFSVFLNETGSSIIFGVDMTKAASTTPVVEFTGNAHSLFNFASIQINDVVVYNNQYENLDLSFDMTINTIALPSVILSSVVDYLCDLMCSNCSYSGDLINCVISSQPQGNGLWPTINIVAGNNSLPITPDQYLLNSSYNTTYTTLNFASFEINSVVLGAPVMQNYYTIFTLDGYNLYNNNNNNYYYYYEYTYSSTVTLYPVQTAPFIGLSDSMIESKSGINSLEVSAELSEISDIEVSDEAALFNETEETSTDETDDEISGVSDDDYSINDESDAPADLSNLSTIASNITVSTASQTQELQRVKQLASKVATMKVMGTSVNQAGGVMNSFVGILSDINQGFQIAEPLLDVLGDCSFLGPITSVIGSFISIFKPAQPSLSEIISKGFTQLSNEIGVVSQEVSQVSVQVAQVEQDIADLSNEIIEATQDIEEILNQVSNQISFVLTQVSVLQGEDQTYFDNLLQDTQTDTCFATFSNYEQVIIGGMQNLNFYMNNNDSSLTTLYESVFVDECGSCADALEGLLNAFSEETKLFGCNLIDLLSKGDSTYHHNWQTQIATKGGYILNLINMGLAIVSAYESIKTNNTEAYKVIGNIHNASYINVIQSLQTAIENCYTNYSTDAQDNLNNFVQEYPSASIGDVTNLLSALYPWKAWIVIPSSDASATIQNSPNSFSIQLASNQSYLYIASFDFNSGLGLISNQSAWLLNTQIQNCMNGGYSNVGTSNNNLFCGQMASFAFPNYSSFEIGTNLINATGATFSTNQFNGGYQTQLGILATIFYSSRANTGPLTTGGSTDEITEQPSIGGITGGSTIQFSSEVFTVYSGIGGSTIGSIGQPTTGGFTTGSTTGGLTETEEQIRTQVVSMGLSGDTINSYYMLFWPAA